MASNLTDQVRGIVKVVTAIGDGKMLVEATVQAKGEVAALAETINNMTDTLATFAEQVISVTREVGVEGRLGGQASIPGAAGSWRAEISPITSTCWPAISRRSPCHCRGRDRGNPG